MKDLSQLGRCLGRTVLVDNDPYSGLLQPCNLLPTHAYYGASSDRWAQNAAVYIPHDLRTREVLLCCRSPFCQLSMARSFHDTGSCMPLMQWRTWACPCCSQQPYLLVLIPLCLVLGS